MTEEYQELGFKERRKSVCMRQIKLSNTIESIVRKVEDRCPECGSEQYVWQQK